MPSRFKGSAHLECK